MIERPCPHASGKHYLRSPVHTQRSGVCAGGCKDRETHNPMRLEDAISVAPYIRSGAEDVRGQKNKGDEDNLRHLKINAIHLDES